jgi:hypothetical protein
MSSPKIAGAYLGKALILSSNAAEAPLKYEPPDVGSYKHQALVLTSARLLQPYCAVVPS